MKNHQLKTLHYINYEFIYYVYKIFDFVTVDMSEAFSYFPHQCPLDIYLILYKHTI